MMTQQVGLHGEQKALDYLLKQGLKLVTRNYSCRWGEVDLILRDGHAFVFVEVRQRTSISHGGGAASITNTKRQKIMKTTSHYLIEHKLQDKFPIRFDVISIDGKLAQVTWIKDAFGVDY